MKTTITSIILAGLLIGGAILLGGRGGAGGGAPDQAANNVSVVDGKQVIDITAKGGYSPRSTSAKADMPTVIRISTQGTFDCSSAVRIPALGFKKNLPASGTVEVEVPPQKAGSKLQGLCAMGMYNFSVSFD